ncbi:MAG: 1-deoxy-D-xylulose-5-phosphate synthase [Dehalococcoidia bacterium]|nr:1-deoxy-D-xylulose-5-phosphate synthase [Dehalococcoidia bacterium]
MSRLLDGIDSPADLKGLTPEQLRQLAGEIRQELVATVGNNGGHLSSNLGAVELSIALHRVFDCPRDKIVWDVGHQSYVHKLLTGRRERFATLRQMGGLSGFTDIAESEHDAFGAGHASTSISAALGIALARDLAGADYHAIAVIGDGSLTGGMAFEALNHAGHLGTRLIVVLNDNAMAISPNVGALARALNRVRLDRRYYRAKAGAEHVFARLPGGRRLWQMGRRFKRGFKRLAIPSMFWEELGFRYIGPLDGHNMEQLQAAFTQACEYRSKPVLIHVRTRKGKGVDSAEADPVTFHGLAPALEKRSSAPTYARVFGQTVARLMAENPKVVAITAAMLEGTGLSPVAREFPDRVFDVGVCEQHAVTLAAGMATQGAIPIVPIYSTFLQRAFDQVIHDVCIQGLPVVFALDRGGIVGEDGKTHQGIFDLSYLRCIPNLVVAAPGDENELQHLLYTAVNSGRPMAIRYPRGSGNGNPPERDLRALPLGKGEVLKQGKDVAVLAVGATVAPSLEAAGLLSELGIDCAVANARFVKPLDTALVESLLAGSRRLVTVEENVLSGGFGSAVLEYLAQAGFQNAEVKCLGLPDAFVEHGSQAQLRAAYGLDAAGIARQVVAVFPDLDRGSRASRLWKART